jgi:hypothetical protein
VVVAWTARPSKEDAVFSSAGVGRHHVGDMKIDTYALGEFVKLQPHAHGSGR